jgi:glycosyltransferase involved in cell wall biosynthesis
MRILIGSIETAGIIKTLSRGLKSLGHKVTTVSSSNVFYSYDYDIDPNKFIETYLPRKIKSKWLKNVLLNLINNLPDFFVNKIKSLFIRDLIRGIDLYIFVYGTVLWPDERFIKYLKANNKKIITLFLGSDIRDYQLFKKKFNISHWSFSEELNQPGGEGKLKKLRLHEKYSDAIFSVPDQSILAERSYFHLKIPMEIDRFKFNIPKNDEPVIIHAPSKPEIKGTDLIINTMEELKKEGLNFKFKLIRGMSHDMLMAELLNADILVDEIVLHGPGFLSFEAMLSGCAVATKYLDNSPPCFKPPIFNINEYNIKDRLRELINDKELITNLAIEGRNYTIKNNCHKKVAKEILDSLNSNEFDYIIV